MDTTPHISHSISLLLVCILLWVLRHSSAFQLEGSQISYAKFPPWDPCQNGSIALEFQTTRPHGLLLYADDGGRFDFLEVKLVGGVVRLRVNLGGGVAVFSEGENLNDGNWHQVEITRDDKKTTLAVDSVEQTKTIQGSEFNFGNISGNSFLYVGGLPIGFSAKLSALALPSVVFEPRLRGSVRNLFYSTCGAPPRRAAMLDNVGVRTNELDECEHQEPCLNRGECISTDTGTICDCTATNYEGQFCQHGKLSCSCRT